MTKHSAGVLLHISFAISFLIADRAFAQSTVAENEIVARRYLRTETGGQHCGLYCVAAAIQSLGGEITAEDLMRSEFISQSDGSTASDLVKMIEALGYQATVIDRISGSAIACSSSPIIIHLDGLRRVEKSHHWITFLGIDDGKPRIFDPPNSTQTSGYGDILAYTSGVGIVVSEKGKPELASLWFGQAELVLWGVLCLFVVLFSANLYRKFSPPNFAAETVLFLVCILTVVAVQQVLPWSSFLQDPVSLAHFREIYADASPPTEVDYEFVRKGVEEGSIAIVDARLPDAFGYGHLPNATNWPVDASTIESRRALEEIPRGVPVVIYCQSKDCIWSDVIGNRLKMRGVEQVYVFRGGYNEWREKSQANRK